MSTEGIQIGLTAAATIFSGLWVVAKYWRPSTGKKVTKAAVPKDKVLSLLKAIAEEDAKLARDAAVAAFRGGSSQASPSYEQLKASFLHKLASLEKERCTEAGVTVEHLESSALFFDKQGDKAIRKAMTAIENYEPIHLVSPAIACKFMSEFVAQLSFFLPKAVAMVENSGVEPQSKRYYDQIIGLMQNAADQSQATVLAKLGVAVPPTAFAAIFAQQAITGVVSAKELMSSVSVLEQTIKSLGLPPQILGHFCEYF